MVNEVFLAVNVAGKSAYTVVDCDNIRIKAFDEIVKCIKRGYLTAGGNVYINTESGDSVVRVRFWESMHCKVTLVKMSVHCFMSDHFSAVA